MKKMLCMVALAALASNAVAFQPRTGLWYNAGESGDGFNIEIQNGVLVLTVYSYKGNGDSEWYLASGAMTNTNHTFTATLDKYRNGQCISCAFKANNIAGNDGAITIAFSSETAATLTLPGGRVTAIAPFNFGHGDPPSGMLGEWILTYDIISTWADRFTFTSVEAGTSDGNGLAYDAIARAGCELQTKGASAGFVLCADISSTGETQNMYAFKFGIDETFSGLWISPSTGTGYTMKGFRMRGRNGMAKSAPEVGDDFWFDAKRDQAIMARSVEVAAHNEHQEALEAVTDAVRALSR